MRTPVFTAATTRRCAMLLALLGSTCSKRAAPPEPAAPATAPLDVPMMARRLVATLEQTHVNVRVVPDSDPTLGYRVLIPKDWRFTRPAAVTPDGSGTVALGTAVGPSDWGSPTISISATSPGVEIPIDAWLRRSLVQAGYSIVVAHWFPSASGLFFEATATSDRDGAAQVRRTSVRADGGHVFAVSCQVPRAHWDQVKEICWVAHDGLTIEKKTGDSRLETWLTAGGKRPDFRMARPASWEVTPAAPPRTDSALVELRLAKVGPTPPARLQVTVEPLSAGPSGAPLERLRDAALERARALGFVPDGVLSRLTEDDDPRALAVAGWLGGFAGKGRLASFDATVRMGFIRHDGRLATFLAVAPAPPADPLVPLRAQRAFEIARATLEAE